MHYRPQTCLSCVRSLVGSGACGSAIEGATSLVRWVSNSVLRDCEFLVNKQTLGTFTSQTWPVLVCRFCWRIVPNIRSENSSCPSRFWSMLSVWWTHRVNSSANGLRVLVEHLGYFFSPSFISVVMNAFCVSSLRLLGTDTILHSRTPIKYISCVCQDKQYAPNTRHVTKTRGKHPIDHSPALSTVFVCLASVKAKFNLTN